MHARGRFLAGGGFRPRCAVGTPVSKAPLPLVESESLGSGLPGVGARDSIPPSPAAAGTGRATLAQELRGGCEGCWSPRLGSVGATTPLTAREHEIALMAAAGLSNREIADRLIVGVRTVEGHLLRIYAKVGVSSRQELATIFTSASPGG